MSKRRNVLENGGMKGNKGNLKTYLEEENVNNQNNNNNNQGGAVKLVNKEAPQNQNQTQQTQPAEQNNGVSNNTPKPNVVLKRGEIDPNTKKVKEVKENTSPNNNNTQGGNTNNSFQEKEVVYDFQKGGNFYNITFNITKVLPKGSLIFGMQGTEEYTTESVIYAKPVVVNGYKEIVYLGGFTFLLLEKNPQNNIYRILDTTVYLGDNITKFTAEAFLATAAVTRPEDILSEMIGHVIGFENQFGNTESFGMGDNDVVVSLLVSRSIIKYLERSSHFKSFKSYNEVGLPDICKFKFPNPRLESYRDVRTDLEFTIGRELDKSNFPIYTCWINYNKNSSKYADYKKFSSLEDFTRMLGEILTGNKDTLNEIEEAFIRSIPHFLLRDFDAELKAAKKNFFIRLEDGSQEKVYPPFTDFSYEEEVETSPQETVRGGVKEGYNAFIENIYSYLS